MKLQQSLADGPKWRTWNRNSWFCKFLEGNGYEPIVWKSTQLLMSFVNKPLSKLKSRLYLVLLCWPVKVNSTVYSKMKISSRKNGPWMLDWPEKFIRFLNIYFTSSRSILIKFKRPFILDCSPKEQNHFFAFTWSSSVLLRLPILQISARFGKISCNFEW